MHLKQVRTIACGRSWYETLGFNPAKCDKWPSDDPTDNAQKLTFDQDPRKYKAAIALVRRTTLRQMRHMIEVNKTSLTSKLLKKFDALMDDITNGDQFPRQLRSNLDWYNNPLLPNARHMFSDDETDNSASGSVCVCFEFEFD